jgi:hypothetical protein
MGSKIDRTGEINYNTFGSKMIITKYRTNRDMDIYFPEYDWTAKNVKYDHFKNGNIKCPYERRTCGIGYLGESKYKVKENGRTTSCYETWHNMLLRCYDEKYHEKYPTYIGCEVCNEWHDYTNFGDWFVDNYYEIEGQKMCLDKDILHKGNKVYSPNTCVFVPNNINVLFIKGNKMRGDYPIGVDYNKINGKFRARCSIYDFKENKNKSKHLGYYNTPEDAFETYKQFKEQNIKEVAEYYKDQIPSKLYDVLYNYKVEITD